VDVSSLLAQQIGFTRDDIRRMHQAALEALHQIGLGVDNATALERLAAAGARVEGGRAHLAPEFVEEQLAQIRLNRDGASGRIRSDARADQEVRQTGKADEAGQEVPLTLSVGDMCQYYHRPFAEGESESPIELMSTEDLIEATKLITSMADAGLGGYVPGVPRDVPSQLQAILEYRIGAEFGPRVTLDTLNPPEALPFIFEMADALGDPMEGGGMFTVSPLRLSGYEFDVAVRHAARWKRFWVTTYPMVGATAPVRLRSAWVLSIAEAIGGAITLHTVGEGKPVYVSIGMFPFDLRTFAAVGGMPECAWMYWASAQVTRYYDPAAGYSMMIGTQAKRPGVQAGYEKAMAGVFGVLTGCNDLHYVGVMSFDDIFSPEQMVLDCELRDMLQQLRGGIPPQDPEEWLRDIQEGVGQGYVAADTTLDHYRDTYWFPQLFDRTSWHSFASGQGSTARARALPAPSADRRRAGGVPKGLARIGRRPKHAISAVARQRIAGRGAATTPSTIPRLRPGHPAVAQFRGHRNRLPGLGGS
jgi:hypothetical protein